MEEQIKNAIEQLTEQGKGGLCEELIRDYGIESPAFAQAAFDAGIFYPRILYQDAPPEIRDKIISLLEQDDVDRNQLNSYLVALAMIGDDTVAEYFDKWEKSPRPWRDKLYVGPYHYATEGGWCIEDEKRKQLFFNECYALEESENAAPEDSLFGGADADKCPYCGSSYVNMLVIDGRDERLSFLGIGGKIKIKYCWSCLPWADAMFCRYAEDGESTILRHEGGENFPIEDEDINNQKCLVLSKKMVPKSYCEEFDRCAIGGRPAFVDDARYETCPECGKKMMHLAQLGCNWFHSDGTHYIQICRDCKIAAVVYQQT